MQGFWADFAGPKAARRIENNAKPSPVPMPKSPPELMHTPPTFLKKLGGVCMASGLTFWASERIIHYRIGQAENEFGAINK